MMHSHILTSLLFFLLIVHVDTRQRRGIADRLVNDQSLAIRRASEDVTDQHRRHGEDMRKHNADRTDQKRYHSRTHPKEVIDRSDDRMHELGSSTRQQDRRIHMRDRSDQGRQSGTRTEILENRDARKQLPARMDERTRYQRQQYRRRIDPRRHNVRRVNIRTQNINQGRDQADQRVASRDRGGNQPVDVSTHRRGTHRTDTVGTRSDIGDKSEVEKAIEYRRRIHQNGQRRISHLSEQRRREYQRILAERRRIQGARNVDSKIASATDTNNPKRIQDRGTIDPTGVNVERVDDPTGVSNREGAERIGLESRKRDDPRGIDIRRIHDPRENNTQERVYQIGIDTRRRHDPTGVYTVDHRRVNSRLISGVHPRQPQIREGGVQIPDQRRHHPRSNTRGEAIDPRLAHLGTDSRATPDKERVNHRRPQVEVSDDSKTNERFDGRTQTGEIADARRGQENTKDDLRNKQSNRRVESTRVVTNRRFDPRRVKSNTRTDPRRLSTRTDARRVNTRDPTRIQASRRRWQHNTDSTKSQIDQARAIDVRRHNRRRTITDTTRTQEHMRIKQLHHSRQQRTNESNQRLHHPRPHSPQEKQNTSKVTIEGLERGHENHFGKPASIKEEERDTVIQDENKNNTNQRTVFGRHTVNSENVHRRRADSRGSNRVDVRTLTVLRAQRDRILRERQIERQRLIQEREEQRRRIIQERENRRILKNGPNETLVDPRRRSVSRGVNSDGGTVNQNVERTQSIHNKEVNSTDPRLDRRRAHTIENNDPPRRRIDPRRVQHYERTIVPNNENAYRNTRRIQPSTRRGLQRVNGRIVDLQDSGRQSHPQSLRGSHNGHPNIALSDGVIIGGPLEIFPSSANATYISGSSIISRVYKNGRGRPIERVLVRPDNERTRSVISDTDPTGVGIGNSRRTIRRQDLPATDTRRSSSTTSNFDPTGIRNSGHSPRREDSTSNDRRRHRFVGTSSVSSTVDSSNAAGEANGRRRGPSRETSGSFRHGSRGNKRPINQFPEQPIAGPKGIIPGAVLE